MEDDYAALAWPDVAAFAGRRIHMPSTELLASCH